MKHLAILGLNMKKILLAILITYTAFLSLKTFSAELSSIRELAKELPLFCGGKLKKIAELKKLKNSAFRKEILKESENKNLPVNEIPYFYSSEKNIIFFNIDSSSNLAWNAKEILLFRQILLFHELVHAWQYQNLPQKILNSKSNVLAIHALLEGHAEYSTMLYCNKMGYEKLYERIKENRENLKGYRSQNFQTDLYFVYYESFLFIKEMAKRKHAMTIQKIFKKRVPTERQIIFPDEYPAKKKYKPADFAIFAKLFKSIPYIPAEMGKTPPPPKDQSPEVTAFLKMKKSRTKAKNKKTELKVAEIGYTGLRTYLEHVPSSYIQERRKILKSFINAERLSLEPCNITCFAFNSPKNAEKLYKIVRGDYLSAFKRNRVEVNVRRMSIPGGGTLNYSWNTVTHKKHGRDLGKFVKLLVMDNKVLFETNWPADKGIDTKKQVKHYLSDYIKLRKKGIK